MHEGLLAREHLVGDDAQGVQIARLPGRASRDLLGGEVFRRADDHPGLGDAGRRALAGDPEVHDLGQSFPGQEDVAGLDVAVDDALGVGGGEARADLDQAIEASAERPGGSDELLHAVADEQLHADVAVSPVIADVVQAGDVRVHQPPRDLELLAEPGQALFVVRSGTEDLQRDFLRQLEVAGPIHGGHAATPDLGLDAIPVGDGRARGERRRRRRSVEVDRIETPGGARGRSRRRRRIRRRSRGEAAAPCRAPKALVLTEHLGQRAVEGRRVLVQVGQALLDAAIARSAGHDLLEDLLRVLRHPVPQVELAEVVEDGQVRVSLRTRGDEGAHELLEADTEGVELAGQTHGDARGLAVAGVPGRHPQQPLQAGGGIARFHVAFRGLQEVAGVREHSRRGVEPAAFPHHPHAVRDRTGLHVRARRLFRPAALFEAAGALQGRRVRRTGHD